MERSMGNEHSRRANLGVRESRTFEQLRSRKAWERLERLYHFQIWFLCISLANQNKSSWNLPELSIVALAKRIAAVRTRMGNERQIMLAHAQQHKIDLPLIILLNKRTLAFFLRLVIMSESHLCAASRWGARNWPMPVLFYCSWVCCGKLKTIRANKLEAFQIPSDRDRNGYFLFPLIQSIGSVDFPFLAVSLIFCNGNGSK